MALPQAINGDINSLSAYNQRAIAKTPSLAARFGVKNYTAPTPGTTSTASNPTPTMDYATLLKSAMTGLQPAQTADTNVTNQYYDTLQKKLNDIQTQGLGSLASGWAGNETLPSSGFYQQQRSDLIKNNMDTGSANELQRAADLAKIATGYTQQAQNLVTGKQTGIQQAQAYNTQGLANASASSKNISDLYSNPYTISSLPNDILKQILESYGYTVTD